MKTSYRRILTIGTIGVAIAATNCAWFQKNASYFPTPADVSCVYAQVENGVSDPASILAACPNLVALAMDDLLALIAGIALGKAHRLDAENHTHLVCVARGGEMVCTTSPADAGTEGGK